MKGRSRGPPIGRGVARALEEDRFDRDQTTRALRLGRGPVIATVRAQGRGVLSGIVPARAAATRAHVAVVRASRDGSLVRPGQEVLRLRGSAGRIFAVERTVLNYLMHLSGVATETARAVRAVRGAHPRMEVWGTRKTLPGLRELEKAAIVHGGGRPHRRDLAEGVLVKSTHLALLPLPLALARLQASGVPLREVEVEVRTPAQALLAARAGVGRLLVDNAGPARGRGVIERLEAAGLRGRVTVELSGGITPANAARYAGTGADAISLGSVTHSSRALPFHLEILTPGRPSP